MRTKSATLPCTDCQEPQKKVFRKPAYGQPAIVHFECPKCKGRFIYKISKDRNGGPNGIDVTAKIVSHGPDWKPDQKPPARPMKNPYDRMR